MTTPVHPPLQTCHVTQAELAEHTLAGETVLSRRLDKLDASLFNAKAEQARSLFEAVRSLACADVHPLGPRFSPNFFSRS
mmetsp:Transcript_7439/g.11697  ORF Transcript_7439/g.11697 Transcript_7439/m.11697 type:complete len:80 (-) Transcript_7439:631-870(-)